MDILNVLKERRSCRDFSSKPVEEEKINKIIEAGLYAPSGRGSQSPLFVVLTNQEKIKELSSFNASIMGLNGIDPFYNAPCVIIVLTDKNAPTYLYDGSLALGNMLNEAESLGLGSIWIHRAKEEFESEKGKLFLNSLGIIGDYEGIGHCCIGYRNSPDQKAKERKPNRVYFVK